MLHIVGTLISYCVAVDYGGNHFKRLEMDQIHALKRNCGNFDALMTISDEGLQDLLWWKQHVDVVCAKIRTNNPDSVLYADASDLGWGAIMNGRKVKGSWSIQHETLHINAKEILAVLFGLQALMDDEN